MVSWEYLSWDTVTWRTALGWMWSFRIEVKLFTRRMRRMTFRPPAVEPPQPPTMIMSRMMNFAKDGHWSKSAETKPVVEEREADWKKVSRSASTNP